MNFVTPAFSRKALSATLLLVSSIAALPAYAASCEDLAAVALPDGRITTAQSVAAGTFSPPNAQPTAAAAYADLPSFCRVTATLTPTSDSEIEIEVWLPLENWNRKLLGVGNGGWTGSIATSALADGLRRGYATVSTDTGHTGGSASFALEHPEKLRDFGHRATHLMTVRAKELIERFYDSAPQYSYFNGCSAGGRQGMQEAQRYPEDYDGIIAGSPGLNWSGRAMQTVWVAQAVHLTAENAIPAEKFRTLHAAALAACDANDGVEDGVIGDPQRCAFDPAVLQCQGEDNMSCLTSAQIATARHIYADVSDRDSGAVIVPGLSPGSELGWGTMAGERPFAPGIDLFKYVVFEDPDWAFTDFDFERDVALTREKSAELDALQTDLSEFFARGGKLLSYHGWSDPQISPGSTVQYYEQVIDTVGSVDELQKHYRLFMVPGMNHCGGGPGTADFDMLPVLEAWVERGEVPARIDAAHSENGTVTRTRPLCPYPQRAVYSGSGSTDDAANFSCQ